MAIEGATLVSVLRHGAVAGRPFVYRGRLDDPLSESGWRQMAAVAMHLGETPFTAVASSPLRRCLDFAMQIARRNVVSMQSNPSFMELDFGAWEGLTAAEAAARDPAEHLLFRSGAGNIAAPGGESLDAARDRIIAGWQNWLHEDAGAHRLLVTHAGVMRILLMELLDLPATSAYRIALPEAASFQVSIMPGEAPILLGLNTCAA